MTTIQANGAREAGQDPEEAVTVSVPKRLLNGNTVGFGAVILIQLAIGAFNSSQKAAEQATRDVASIAGKVDSLAAKVDATAIDVASIKSDLGSLKAGQAAQAGATAELSKTVGSLERAVGNIDYRFSSIEREVTKASARKP